MLHVSKFHCEAIKINGLNFTDSNKQYKFPPPPGVCFVNVCLNTHTHQYLYLKHFVLYHPRMFFDNFISCRTVFILLLLHIAHRQIFRPINTILFLPPWKCAL